MLRQSLFICSNLIALLIQREKKALAVGYCDVSDAEKDLHPSIKIPSLIMSEMVQDALICFGCLLVFLTEEENKR
jgi:hypothetical protein